MKEVKIGEEMAAFWKGRERYWKQRSCSKPAGLRLGGLFPLLPSASRRGGKSRTPPAAPVLSAPVTRGPMLLAAAVSATSPELAGGRSRDGTRLLRSSSCADVAVLLTRPNGGSPGRGLPVLPLAVPLRSAALRCAAGAALGGGCGRWAAPWASFARDRATCGAR